MNWTAFIYVMVIFIMASLLLVAWVWPRDADNNLLDIEEVEKFLSKFPRPPKNNDRALKWMIAIFATLAMIGTALTSSKPERGDDHYD